MSRMFHFTCDHGFEGIKQLGYVAPNWHPLLGMKVAWFTDLETPNAETVGLTSNLLNCDRLAHSVEVDPSRVRRWLGSGEQASTPPLIQADLHRGSDPSHWWISRIQVPVLRYQIGNPADV